MPIATDSGYLPDWLAALIGQGQIGPNNAPVGLFSDTAAMGSPAPNIGLLSSLPQFTGVQPNAPAFQGGNAPNGPLPDQSPTFSYMSPTPPWGGSGPSNSYPSMAMPQDPGPMNIGPGGAAPSFTGVSPNAPFTANIPNSVRDQYADVPLPPRRPNDLTSFQAQADPQDINTPPPGRPNANVIGTQASGAPEVTAQKSLGLGDYLGRAANAIGGIYGAGGPGDALIALGLSNRTNGASIQALNSMNANRASQVNLALKQYDLATKQRRENSSYQYLVSKGADPAVASAAIDNPELMKSLIQQNESLDQWVRGGNDAYGNPIVYKKDDPTKTMVLGAGGGASGSNSGAAQPGSANGLINEKNADLQGEDFLATVPQGYANRVRSILGGQEQFPSSFQMNKPENRVVAELVRQADPNFDASDYNSRVKMRQDFMSGTPQSTGGQIRAGNTAIAHLGTLHEAAANLDNSSWPGWNYVKQTYGTKTGGASNKEAFDDIRERYADEITKFYRGSGGSQRDIQRVIEGFNSAKSPEQLQKRIEAEMKLIKGREEEIQSQWQSGMGTKVAPFQVITPGSQAVLDKIQSNPLTGPKADAPVTSTKQAETPAQKKRMKFNQETGLLE